MKISRQDFPALGCEKCVHALGCGGDAFQRDEHGGAEIVRCVLRCVEAEQDVDDAGGFGAEAVVVVFAEPEGEGSELGEGEGVVRHAGGCGIP